MVIFSIFTKLFSRNFLPSSVDVLVVGLGNIGPEYISTRHNIGFRVARALGARFAGAQHGTFGDADFLCGELFSSTRVMAIMPRTLMNRSGTAVRKYLAQWQLPLSRMLVVVDDYNLPLGKLRARAGGSDGGHNGLKSISGYCGEDFPRLRVGIGPPGANKGPCIDFVLGKFTDAEEEQLKKVVPLAADACELFAQKDVQAVMNTFNGL
jgi:peptidyl-tRNA hydrolase, PTH1 family